MEGLKYWDSRIFHQNKNGFSKPSDLVSSMNQQAQQTWGHMQDHRRYGFGRFIGSEGDTYLVHRNFWGIRPLFQAYTLDCLWTSESPLTKYLIFGEKFLLTFLETFPGHQRYHRACFWENVLAEDLGPVEPDVSDCGLQTCNYQKAEDDLLVYWVRLFMTCCQGTIQI